MFKYFQDWELYKKKQPKENQQNNEVKTMIIEEDSEGDLEEDADGMDIDDSSWSDCEGASQLRQSKTNKRLILKSTALVCDRYGVSDRAAAAIISTFLEDNFCGYINKSECVVDHLRLRRARQRMRKTLRSQQKVSKFVGLFFDGRKDKTLKTTTEGNITRTRTVQEEHVSLIAEPNGKYLGHISTSLSSSVAITDKIFEFLDGEEIKKEFLAVGCEHKCEHGLERWHYQRNGNSYESTLAMADLYASFK